MMSESRERQLIKNTGIIAIGTICSKVFSFFLLPLYTTVLTTSDYGTVDVLQSISSFMMPLVTLELSTGAFRFLIEKKEEDYGSVVSSVFFIEAMNILLFTASVFVINAIRPIPYCGLFVFYFSSFALLLLNQNIARGLGCNGVYSIMSFMLTFISLLSNILLILVFGKKGDSILLSAGLAYCMTSVFCIARLSLWRYINRTSFSKDILKEILRYCLPLIPNAVSWWVANTSDRLIIRGVIGVGYNGIYAAANKVPMIYITFFNVYNIAWIEALSRGADDPNQEMFINDIFKKSIRLFSCINLTIICGIGIVFDFIIGKDYVAAYWHIYILLVAAFFNSLCSLLGGIFTSFKRSDIIGKTTVFGAITNIFIHLLTIPFIGLYAASISTLASYIVIMALRNNNAKKLIHLEWPREFLFQLTVMLLIVAMGYYTRSMRINSIILIAVLTWSYYHNRGIIKELFLIAKHKTEQLYRTDREDNHD